MNTIYDTPCGGVRTSLDTLRWSDTAKAMGCSNALAGTAVSCMLLFRNHSRWIIGYDNGVP